MACMYIGAVPILTYPVDLRSKDDGLSAKFVHIVQTTKPKLILADGKVLQYRMKASLLVQITSSVHSTPWVICGRDKRFLQPIEIALEDDAMIQYTAGTSDVDGGIPKGAILTHGNVLSEMLFIGASLEETIDNPDDIHCVAWVPPYHDLGLFMNLLITLVAGMDMKAMGPLTFIKDPLRWFKYMSEYRCTHTAGPNFAFSLCLDRIKSMDPGMLQP